MAIRFLTNKAGDFATGIVFNSGTPDPAYSDRWMISGPRSLLFKGAAATVGTEPGYVFPSTLACDYMVVARADLLLTATGMRVRPIQRSAGGTWSFISSVDYNPLSASNLVGVRKQDLVFPVSPTQTRGIGISAYNGGAVSEAMMFAKLYGCQAFDFGVGPAQGGVSFENVAADFYFTPLRGTWPYEVEKRIVMTFQKVPAAKIRQFKALPQILNWPLFIYDTTGDTLPQRLEHVVIESYGQTLNSNRSGNVQISFLRLKHYD